MKFDKEITASTVKKDIKEDLMKFKMINSINKVKALNKVIALNKRKG